MSKTQGSKVFTIKPHKFASMGTEQAAAMWRELEASLLQIYEERQSTLSYEENYRCVCAHWLMIRGASRLGLSVPHPLSTAAPSTTVHLPPLLATPPAAAWRTT